MENNNKIVVLWTSADKAVAEKMVFMYTLNAKLRNWFEEVNLIVWGPSSELLSNDEELQDYVRNMLNVGVNIRACRACADMYGVTEQIQGMGISVEYMGEPLTEYIKNNYKILTF